MKKDILFIITSLCAGGGQKSLVNLLNQINYEEYNVDLFLIEKDGLFISSIPEEVNIIDIPNGLQIFKLPLLNSIIKYIRKGNFLLAYSRIAFTVINRILKNKDKAEQITAKYMCRAIGKIDKKYDASIGFLEKTSNYICVENINANIKIGWIHTEYGKSGMDKRIDNYYFNKLDYIATISEECIEVLKKIFSQYDSKFKLIYNIVSPELIRKMSLEDIEDITFDSKKINIISVGRLHRNKAFELAIGACKILKDNKYNINWFVLGEGEERQNLHELIKENKLEKEFKLLGNRENPYKYMRKCDIYVQTSKFEGKSIAIDEAKILSMPIVITNFSTAKDQIDNDITGLIVEMSDKEIANGIMNIINDSNLSNRLKDRLNKEKLGTEDEVHKIYELIN